MNVDMQKAKQFREDGLTFREIAAELGCSEGYLRAKLKGVAKGVKYVEKSVEEELKRISKELANVVKRIEMGQL